jgi:putative transposase
MEHYRTGPHSRFDLKYHFVWITKYRKGVLAGEVGVRLRELVREVCRTYSNSRPAIFALKTRLV